MGEPQARTFGELLIDCEEDRTLRAVLVGDAAGSGACAAVERGREAIAVVEVREVDGPRGGEYFFVDLSDGRAVSVSRKLDDARVWLGRPDEPGSYHDQRGGIGTIHKLLDEWRAQLALDPAKREMYEALVALKAARER